MKTVDDWKQANGTEYVRRGQVQALLQVLGIGVNKVTVLFPPGCDAEFYLPNLGHRLFRRERVLNVLGVSGTANPGQSD